VEKLREDSNTDGGDVYLRGQRAKDAVDWAGRYGEHVRAVAMREVEREAWRRAARHGRCCP
jgi:hypothetical protein